MQTNLLRKHILGENKLVFIKPQQTSALMSIQLFSCMDLCGTDCKQMLPVNINPHVLKLHLKLHFELAENRLACLMFLLFPVTSQKIKNEGISVRVQANCLRELNSQIQSEVETVNDFTLFNNVYYA